MFFRNISLSKFLTALLTVTLLCTTAANAQNEKIRFDGGELHTGEIIAIIEAGTPLQFAYNLATFSTQRTVTMPAGELSITDVMDIMLKDTKYGYTIRNGFIVVNEKPAQKSTRESAVSNVSRTGDIYRPNNVRNLDAHPLSKPVATKTDVVMQPAQLPAEPPAYSSYSPVGSDSYLQEHLPHFALKTNLLYGAATFTPNLSAELGIGKRSTIAFTYSYNSYRKTATAENKPKQLHWIARPEYRYWFCERFNGHFLGADVFWSEYNVSERNVLWLFDSDYRYRGSAVGGSINYGYHWAISKRWGLEFNIGAGVARLKYDRYTCQLCDRTPEKGLTRTYFGPTNAGITLVFLIR